MALKKFFCVQMVLIFCLILLSSCSSETDQTLSVIENFYTTLETFSAWVRAQVQLSDRVQDYVLDWEYSHGSYTVTVAEPEALAGICISGSEDSGLTFSYDAVTLAVDPTGNVISPLEALCEILKDWRGNIPDEYGFEQCQDQNTLAVSYSHPHEGSTFSQRVWFDPLSCIPLYVEAYSDGAMIADFEFLLFQLQ